MKIILFLRLNYVICSPAIENWKPFQTIQTILQFFIIQANMFAHQVLKHMHELTSKRQNKKTKRFAEKDGVIKGDRSP